MEDLLKLPGVVGCEFNKGEYIIRQGEKIQYVYYLATGSCYRSTFTEKGDEIIFGVKKSSADFIQSILGVLILYTDSETSVNNFIAENKCTCYKIPNATFLHYVKDKPDVLSKLLSMAMSELRELTSSFQARQEGKVANRLCELMIKNSALQQGRLLVNKDYSNQTKISQFLGIHKVTVAKIMKALKEEGVIEKEKARIVILDKERLEKYARAEKNIDY